MKHSLALKLLIVIYVGLGMMLNSKSIYAAPIPSCQKQCIKINLDKEVAQTKDTAHNLSIVAISILADNRAVVDERETMNEVFDKIKNDAEERMLRNNNGNQDFLLYLDHKVMKEGEVLDIVTAKIEFEGPTMVVFVDNDPGMNFGHRCKYLLYHAETGIFIRMISAEFPYFLLNQPESLELFRTSESIKRYKRK